MFIVHDTSYRLLNVLPLVSQMHVGQKPNAQLNSSFFGNFRVSNDAMVGRGLSLLQQTGFYSGSS